MSEAFQPGLYQECLDKLSAEALRCGLTEKTHCAHERSANRSADSAAETGAVMRKHRNSPFPALLMDGLRQRLRFYRLTPREEEIAFLLLQGFTNKAIAERCYISEQTVKDHLKHVYHKMGIHHRAALLLRLVQTQGS